MATKTLGAYTRVALLSSAIVALAYFFLLVLAPLSRPDFFVSGNQKTGMGCSDFVLFYGAGTLSCSSARFNIYDIPTQLEIENQLIAPAKMSQAFYMQYPPWFFTMVIPLVLLPIKSAFVVWTIIWPTLAALSLYLLLTTTEMKSKLDRALLITFALASAPTIMGVKTGQTSLWFFTCICLLWYTWRTGASKLNALSLVVSTFKLQYSIFFVIPHVAQRKWRTLLWICLFQLAFVLAACLNVGWKNIIDYPQFLLSTETSGAMGVAPESMSNFGALLLRYLPKTSALIGTLSVLAASLIYLFSVWWRWAKIPKKNDGWPIAVTCVLALVASPHTHFHMCVLFRPRGSRHPKNYQPDEKCRRSLCRIQVMGAASDLLSMPVLANCYDNRDFTGTYFGDAEFGFRSSSNR